MDVLHEIWRTAPIYTVAEVASLTGMGTATVRRWLGYDGRAPVLNNQEPGTLVSFLTLAELVVVQGFRRNRVGLQRVREAHDFAAEQLGVAYPFASLRLTTLGGRILAQFEEAHPGASLMVLERPGAEWTLPGLVTDALRAFEYDAEDLAYRWFPRGKATPIVVDPRFASGMPTLLSTGVTVETVRKRFNSGLSVAFIADDLQLDGAMIEEALRDKAAV